MSPSQHRQRGEGKIGCAVSLLILGLCAGVGYKAIPIFWANYELKDAANEIASRASAFPVETIEQRLRSKAKELEIPEAVAVGAIQVVKRGDGQQGKCMISLKYQRKIDLFGVYTWTAVMDEEITAPYMNAY